MTKERIEKTLVVFKEDEVKEILQILLGNADEEIGNFMFKVFIKKVEAILRRRCG